MEDEDLEGLPWTEDLSPAEEWAYSGEFWSGFSSSNVRSLAYDHEGEKLTVEYQGGTFWEYRVTLPMALALYGAPSKGTWIWDHVKVRGTVHGHQVEATKFTFTK